MFLFCLARAFCLTLFVLLAARLAMLALVWGEVRALPWADVATALYIGAKFDARLSVFICLPLALALGLPWFERRMATLGPWLAGLYAASMLCVVVAYVIDFGFFFYLRQRVDSTLFELIPDVAISATMVWQSYPVVRIALALVAVTAFFAWSMSRLLRGFRPGTGMSKKARCGWVLGLVCVLFVIGYGQISSNLFPLRWSNAYFSPNRYMVILALNPVQNLYDSYIALHASQPDMKAVRAAYPRMAPWLGVERPDEKKLDYWRHSPGMDRTRPNVVIILMESLGTPRTSLAGGLFRPGALPEDPGPDDPTPNLRRLAGQSLYFPWFVAPTRTTSRAIFTTVTGIPDVNRSGGTSSRNPALVDQFSIISEFKGYDISYMIGGSASWANIRGILTHNIPGLNLREEGAWKAPNTDVWGISDLALLLESADYYNTCPKPFFSFIQTAGFHRPWTIPKDNAGFTPRTVSDEVIRHYGFENVDEYNSMRFVDHALGEFFRVASRAPWFANTIFVIMGDHGLNEPSANVPAGYLGCRLQSNHVPLLIYAPGLPDRVTPGVNDLPSGQPDVLPTLAELAGIPYRNHGIGRNLLDPERIRAGQEGREPLFLGGDSETAMRLVQNGYCYLHEGLEALYLLDGNGENLLAQEPERAAAMRQTAEDTFHTAKYLLFNNQKAKAPPLP